MRVQISFFMILSCLLALTFHHNTPLLKKSHTRCCCCCCCCCCLPYSKYYIIIFKVAVISQHVRCGSASRSVLIKTLITSIRWWYCTQSAGVLPPSARRLKVSSNLFSNTATIGSVCLAPIFPSATFSMKALMSQRSSSLKASFMMC